MTDKSNPQQQLNQDQGDSETKSETEAAKSLQAQVRKASEKKKRLKFGEEDMIKIKYDF